MTWGSTIRPPTLEDVRAWQRKPRKPIARVGRRKRREQAAESEFRAQVRMRAEGRCEAAGLATRVGLVCGTKYGHQGHHAHHVWPEDRDCGVHDPERGLWLCFEAHSWVHDHPEDAKMLRLMREVRP